MHGVEDDLAVWRAAISVSRKEMLVKLLARLMVENDPYRRQAITDSLFRVFGTEEHS